MPLLHPEDQMFLNGYGFLIFQKDIGKNIGKNISKNLSGEYSQKLPDHAKQPATDAFKPAPNRAIQKTADTAGDFIGNKTANKITKAQKNHNKINQRQLQLKMIQNYLNKDIYY